MWRVLLIAVGLSIGSHAWATSVETSTGAGDDEVAVEFLGDEEVVGDRIEEIAWESLDDVPPLPEYDHRSWLVGFPLLLVVLVAWNTEWKSARRRHSSGKTR